MNRNALSRILLLVGFLPPSFVLAERINHTFVANFVLGSTVGDFNPGDLIAWMDGVIEIPRVDESLFTLHSVKASVEVTGFGYSFAFGETSLNSGFFYHLGWLESIYPPYDGVAYYGTSSGRQTGRFGGGHGLTVLVNEEIPGNSSSNSPRGRELSDFIYNSSLEPEEATLILNYTSFAFAAGGSFVAAGISSPIVTIEYELERVPETMGDLPTPWPNQSVLVGSTTPTHDFPGVRDWEIPDYLQFSGDYNIDLKVDQADYLTWASEYGSTSDTLTADGNGDGVVNAADYTIWRDNLGGGLEVEGNNATAVESVPEPSSIAGVLCLTLTYVGVGRAVRRR